MKQVNKKVLKVVERVMRKEAVYGDVYKRQPISRI